MAEIAGRTADGICVPLGSTAADLVAVARRARAGSGRDPLGFLVVATLPPGLEPSRAATLDGVRSRLILYAVASLLMRRWAEPPISCDGRSDGPVATGSAPEPRLLMGMSS